MCLCFHCMHSMLRIILRCSNAFNECTSIDREQHGEDKGKPASITFYLGSVKLVLHNTVITYNSELTGGFI